jgi:HEAT repeat protein
VNDLEKPEKIALVEAIREHEREPEEARARLLELLSDEDEDVRAEAAGAVWEHADLPELVGRALELSAGDPSPRVRAKATTALGRVIYEGSMAGADLPGYSPDPLLGEPDAEEYARVRDHLLAAARDEKRSLDERRFALEGLGFLGDDPRVAALIESFWARSEPAARLSAVFAMGRSGTGRFGEAIQEALATSDSELRLQAIWASGESEVQGARDLLLRFVRQSESQQERLASIEALSRLGGDAVAQVLLDLAEHDQDPEVREAASTGLEELSLLDSIDDDQEGQDDEN